jgi:hypothetical protein
MDVVYGGGQFVAVGTNGYGTAYGGIVATSPDGVAWTARASAVSPGLNAVAYGNGVYVAAGNLGALQYSTDGVAWNSISTGTASHLDGVNFVNGRFVVIGHDGVVMNSVNGTIWTRTSSGAANLLAGIAYAGGQYVAVGNPMAGGGAAKIMVSADLATWADVSPPSLPTYLKRIVYAGGLFVAAGTAIVTSTDGITWQMAVTNPEGSFTGGALAWTGSSFVAVGNGGRILRSR